MDEHISFDVQFSGSGLPVTLPLNATVLDLKNQLEAYTGIAIDRQLILNLTDVKDNTQLASMELNNVEMVEVAAKEVDTKANNADVNAEDNANANANANEEVANTNGNDNNNNNNNDNDNANEDGNAADRPIATSDEILEEFDEDDGDYEVYQGNGYATNFMPAASSDAMSAYDLMNIIDQLPHNNFAEDLKAMGLIVPPSYEHSFKEALAHGRKTGKLILTYLHNPDSDLAHTFCLDILQSEEIKQYIADNYVFWVGTINAGIETFLMSQDRFESYPIVAIVGNFRGSIPKLLEVVEGINDITKFYESISNQSNASQRELTKVMIEEEEKQEKRKLVEEQDLAYEESLKADIEKARIQEEERQKLEAEAWAAEEKKNERLSHGKLVPEEPAKGPDSTHVVFKLPNDERLERRFNSTDTIETLSNYLDGSGVEFGSYQFITMFPKRVYTKQDFKLTLKEAEIHPQCILNVRSEDD
ncbi:hypothetical protein SAMD00019534_065410 [Acytostelium subglobosum LB1]|uniref:hypothetical protein n=1 Tax=Acytostelium subglobosum LB1 TaxID=1410327 RepID=UPI000644D369|nr:hypothetical protein SAMD00019534_065410 [Acytostelium subglobosum LB1]GAM23366.1 hypothetical protein SAMD00019534_065410 [Acytostelium subglobosum LB1]|eukprot:XP_012753815.1 hypothetical protein SAMD00019534_065410 [Acytostelium subglobosum LB1]